MSVDDMLTPTGHERILSLRTRDRHSGEFVTHPLFFRRAGDRLVIAAANETALYKPEWYLNLKEAPIVEIEMNGDTTFAVATTPVGTERLKIWPLVEELSRDTERFLPRNVTGIVLTPME
ncbi:MAG: nitroreductase family deazaflavin-dependent oxidoreductase [Pseudomonadales bacterium]|nr:nitroreductase family deazaflavin-dependent oxidoreductase [Pseudomonadales bacterium]